MRCARGPDFSCSFFDVALFEGRWFEPGRKLLTSKPTSVQVTLSTLTKSSRSETFVSNHADTEDKLCESTEGGDRQVD